MELQHQRICLVHYHEIGLKGHNRSTFEKRLLKNVEALLVDFPVVTIHRIAGITTCHVRPLHTSEYPTPAARPHYSVLDKTKIKQTYGLEIPYWEESLRECISQLLLINES